MPFPTYNGVTLESLLYREDCTALGQIPLVKSQPAAVFVAAEF